MLSKMVFYHIGQMTVNLFTVLVVFNNIQTVKLNYANVLFSNIQIVINWNIYNKMSRNLSWERF